MNNQLIAVRVNGKEVIKDDSKKAIILLLLWNRYSNIELEYQAYGFRYFINFLHLNHKFIQSSMHI